VNRLYQTKKTVDNSPKKQKKNEEEDEEEYYPDDTEHDFDEGKPPEGADV
jgi:hypothetical protein